MGNTNIPSQPTSSLPRTPSAQNKAPVRSNPESALTRTNLLFVLQHAYAITR